MVAFNPNTPRRLAAKRGQKTYTEKGPCRRGHEPIRYTCNGKCVSCSSLKTKEWNANNRERTNELWRDWCERNYEDRLEYKRARNCEAKPETKRKWFALNKEKSRASGRKYYEKNKDKYRLKVRNREALLRGATGKHSQGDIDSLLKVQKWKCAYCASSVRLRHHVDHIHPLALGGSNDKTNLQILCVSCNLSKGALVPIVYAQKIGMLL